MLNNTLTETGGDWRERVAELQKLVAQAQTELIDAETEIADRLAAINAFEFKLRAATAHLVARLDKLEAEIRGYRQKLRSLADDWRDAPHKSGGWSVDDVEDVAGGAGPQASGRFRYRAAAPESAPQELDEDTGAELKQLYRQLARRFHPDLALDGADRDYRTQLMMAINAAYAAHDLEKLRQLALEPDSAGGIDLSSASQLLAEALWRELERCRRRLAELKEEMDRLEKHKSARLMRQAEQAERQGRDWQAEMQAQLREQITRKMVERDVLQQEVEFNEGMASELDGDAFADAVWDFSLEYAYDEDPETAVEEWTFRRRDKFSFDEDNLDDSE